jgi:hypothetical protein
MAHDRKGSESGAAMKTRSPVPAAKREDPEDVAWALQTAEATWSRGEHADALKWIRRAAEAASEAEVDDRALELAKAAADVASILSEKTQVTHASGVPAAPPAPRIGTTSRPPTAIPAASTTVPGGVLAPGRTSAAPTPA